MLTPAQIRDYRFQSAGRGLYKADEVDEIYSKVIASYEQMFRENSELIKRVSMLAEKVESYRQDEELIQKTLLVAQKKADEIEDESSKAAAERRAAAERKAQELEADAQTRAQEKLADAQARADRIRVEADENSAATVRAAEKRANEILVETTAKAQATLQRLKQEIAENLRTMEVLKEKHNALREQVKSAYEEQLLAVSALPVLKLESVEKLNSEAVDPFEAELAEIAKNYESKAQKLAETDVPPAPAATEEVPAPVEAAPAEEVLPNPVLPEEEAAAEETPAAPAQEKRGFQVHMEQLAADDDADAADDKAGAFVNTGDNAGQHRKIFGKGKK